MFQFNDCQCSYFWVPTISLEPQGLIDSFLFMTHLGIVIRVCRGPFDLFVFFIIYFEDQDTPPTKKNNACYMCIHAFQSTKFHQYFSDSWYCFR